MRRMVPVLIVLAALLFAYAPVAIGRAPFESTMGLVQKIFYFHVPSWFAMFLSTFICGIASIVFLFRRRSGPPTPLPRRRRSSSSFRSHRTNHRAAVGSTRAWGVWWQWDAKLTTALVLWLIFVAYLLLQRYGGPRSERLAQDSRCSAWQTCRSSIGRCISGAPCIL